MDPVKEVLTMKDCLVNPVEDHCRPVIAGHLDLITYFPYGIVPYAKHSV